MFNAEISAGALLVVETKKIAKLMLTNPSTETWKHAIEIENILQKRTPSTAKRQANLVRKRLELINFEILNNIAEADNELTLQLIFASSLLQSRLHYDYMVKVYGAHLQKLDTHISKNAWENFWDECLLLDPSISVWSELTKNKLHQVIIKILSEAKYIDSTRNRMLTPPFMRPEAIDLVKKYHSQILNGLEFSK